MSVRELSLDEHLLHCAVCSSGEDACEIGMQLAASDPEMSSGRPADTAAAVSERGQRWTTLDAHRRQYHDPRNPEHEPCCAECCDCSLVCLSDADDERDWEASRHEH